MSENKIQVSGFPELLVTSDVLVKLTGWIEAAGDLECGGLGTVDVKPGRLFVEEVFLTKEHVSVGLVEHDIKDVARLYNTLTAKGYPGSRLRVWWHSHHRMRGVSWSRTDEDNIRKLVQLNGAFLVSILGYTGGKFRARLDIAQPPLAFDEIPIVVAPSVSPELREICRREIAENCKISWYDKITGIAKFLGSSKEENDLPQSFVLSQSPEDASQGDSHE